MPRRLYIMGQGVRCSGGWWVARGWWVVDWWLECRARARVSWITLQAAAGCCAVRIQKRTTLSSNAATPLANTSCAPADATCWLDPLRPAARQNTCAVAGYCTHLAPTGVLQATFFVFKLGRRASLLSFAPSCWALLQKWLRSRHLAGNMLARKLAIKLAQRVGLTFLQPRLAPWRYRRGGGDGGPAFGDGDLGAGTCGRAGGRGEGEGRCWGLFSTMCTEDNTTRTTSDFHSSAHI